MKLENLYSQRATPVSTDTTDEHAAITSTDATAVQTATQEIIVGDCLDVMRRMGSGTADVIVTSPPYNIGMPYRSYDDRRPRDEYLAWMNEVAAEIARILADDGSLFLNLGSTGTDPWIAQDVAAQFRDHLVLQNRITWVKSISIDGVTKGHQKPVNSRRFFTRTNEEILHFTKTGAVPIARLAIGVPYADKANLSRWKHAQADLRCGGNTWFVPYETVRNAAGKHRHPAGFPVELPLRCLKLHGKVRMVLDPFAGSGSTLVAAKQLGWSAVGIEIDKVYAETAMKRIAATALG